ncbi:MAG: hypothetical protein ACJAVK_003197 [Akkermansiaceae bacterium]|jgi:hypothetical protein
MNTLILANARALPLGAEPAWLKDVNIPEEAPLKQITPAKLSDAMI